MIRAAPEDSTSMDALAEVVWSAAADMCRETRWSVELRIMSYRCLES